MLDKEDGIYVKDTLKKQKTIVSPVTDEDSSSSVIDEDKDKEKKNKW